MTTDFDAIVKAFNQLREPPYFTSCDRWLSDEQWVAYLSRDAGLIGLDYTSFNSALSRDKMFGMYFQSAQTKNPAGIYRCQHKVGNRKVWFYYIPSDKEFVPVPHPNINWVEAFHNTIETEIQTRRKRSSQRQQDDGVVVPLVAADTLDVVESARLKRTRRMTVTPSDSVTDEQQQLSRIDDNNLSDVTRQLDIPDFWADSSIRKLFGCSEQPTAFFTLNDYVDKLEQAENDTKVLLSLVNRADEVSLNAREVLSSQVKARYLRLAYKNALDFMPDGKLNWDECCQKAIRDLKAVGFMNIKASRTIQQWNLYFRKYQCFPHPNVYVELQKQTMPKLFVVYPEALDDFKSWANRNMETLSSERASVYVKNELIVKYFHQYQDECRVAEEQEEAIMSQDEFRRWLNLKTVDPSTVFLWLKKFGFRYNEHKQVYYNDRHEADDNKTYRKWFIDMYFANELLAHRWVHVPAAEAQKLEGEETESQKRQLLKDLFAEEYMSDDGVTLMREYHVDSCSLFLDRFVSEEGKKYGGDLSRRRPVDENPWLIVGQDESIMKENTFTSRYWHGSEGQSILRPKDDGHGLMISAFISRAWSFDVSGLLTDDILQLVNESRDGQKYLSVDAANEIKDKEDKEPLDGTEMFCRFFEYGADKEGYWNGFHSALQLEDLVDCLVKIYPNVNFLFLFDQSSGHNKRQPDGLSVRLMNTTFGGSVPAMRSTIIEDGCLGSYPCPLKIGDEQSMFFKETDEGPFYLTAEERQRTKYNQPTGIFKKHTRTRRELLELIQQKSGKELRTYKSTDALKELAGTLGIDLEVEQEVIKEGWCHAPKGLAQVLYERGLIDVSDWKKKKYIRDKRKSWKDDKGGILAEYEDEYKQYSLTYLLSQCADFKNEKSALEKLAEDLSSRHGVKIKVLLTPKYHCELAGEGIEYAWGLAKKTFRRMPYKDKHGKAKFHGCARSSLYSVTVDHIRKYSARCRRYMLTYQLFDAQVPDDEAAKIGISYDVLESYVNTKMKAHRCTADQESRFIAEEWRKAQESRQIIG